MGMRYIIRPYSTQCSLGTLGRKAFTNQAIEETALPTRRRF